MDAPKIIVKLYLGEQDGSVLQLRKKPEQVMRVPNYHALNYMAEQAQAGHVITANMIDDADRLPYVMRKLYLGLEGELIYEFEYCEEINSYQPDPDV